MPPDVGTTAREFARAKVNLSLHVTGKRADGYHLLDSLVVFPRLGDMIEAEPAQGLSLALKGTFAGDLDAGADNLVLRAALMLERPGRGAALRLTKRLPVASGIGGGSADAAAALRLLARLWDVEMPPPERLLQLGADVPVCVASRACRMRGIGADLVPLDLPMFWIVLVNPAVKVATGAVFDNLATRDNAPMPDPPGFPDADALFAYLRAQRNDLEAPARGVAPVIGEVVAALGGQAGCEGARMSGSGATCFGLFAREAAARAAAEALARARPSWWIAAAEVA